MHRTVFGADRGDAAGRDVDIPRVDERIEGRTKRKGSLDWLLPAQAPPSAVAAEVFRWYRALCPGKKPKIEWVETAHAPPYGYGKNHGYTRIVRLALPLTASVAAAAAGDAAATLRQHVRWHCRVSHVAAHTALLTLFADDFATPEARRPF